MREVAADVKGNLIIMTLTPPSAENVALVRDVPGRRYRANDCKWTAPATASVAAAIMERWGADSVHGTPEFDALRQSADALNAAQEAKSADELEQPELRKCDSWQHQLRGYQFALPLKAACLYMGMGPQPVDEPVLTPGGFVPLNTIRPGDYVIGKNGKPTMVIGVYPQGWLDAYSVTTSDGASTICSENHLWAVQTPKQKYRGTEPRVMPLRAIMDAGLRNASGNWNWFIPTPEPVEYEKCESLPIDPYLLGVILGDGCTRSGVCITSGDADAMIELLTPLLPCSMMIRRGDELNLHIIARRRGDNNTVIGALRDLGIYGELSIEKTIPKCYMLASVADRVSLLQGLLDTDGYMDAEKTGIEYSTSSPQLAIDAQELIRSIGGTCTVNIKYTKCAPSYRMYVKLPTSVNPFRLERRIKSYEKSKPNPTRSIRSIEPCGARRMMCIEVEASDGLYVTRDFVVTHNSGKSKIVVDLIINRGHKRVLIVAPKSVITGECELGKGASLDALAVWPREFYKFAGHDNWKCWNDTKGTCERRAQHMLDFVALCEARGDTAVVLVNYEAAWRPEMAAAIHEIAFDLVVADEQHKIKSSNGTASKFFGKLGDTVPYRIGLTGTLMPHSPMDLYGQYRFLDKGVFGVSFTAFRARYAVMGGYGGHEIKGYQHEDELRAKAERLYYHVGSEVLDLPEAVHTYRVVSLSPETLRAYKQMEQTFIADVGAGRVVASNALSKLLRLQQLTSGYLPREDSEDVVQISTEKMDALRDVLTDIDPREPVVVFCRFRHDLDMVAMAARLEQRTCAELSGRVNELAKWQDGGADVLAVQIQAGGVGIDLTRARYCVYYGLGYDLGAYLQSLARVHRPGQRRGVIYVHLLADHTIDQKVYDALQKRQDVITEIFHNLNC